MHVPSHVRTYRWMFITDWGEEPKIERVSMDGDNRTTIVSADLGSPSGITLDYAARRVYWTDPALDRIEYCSFDGSGRAVLLSNGSGLENPFAITLQGNYLYWTEWSELSVFAVDKLEPGETEIVTLFGLVPYGIEAVTPDRQNDGKFA